MERTITYKITDSVQNIRIDSFLRKHGYSMQNLTLLKKMPESILKNGEWSYMQTTLQAGDILTDGRTDNRADCGVHAWSISSTC